MPRIGPSLPVDPETVDPEHAMERASDNFIVCELMLGTTTTESYADFDANDIQYGGKQADEGVLLDLLKLRIDSGDNKLKSHFEKCRRNAIYTSPRIQNELINLCGEVIQENVISEVRKTMAYSILADETADVSGKEQLSIGVRFYDESKSKIREEFVGFVELKAQNASAIAEAIDNFLISSNLSKEDCVGFGFDGCSTMAGKEGGVQAILRKKYPRALYFHCSSHKLNLVVNDANAVPEIRNTVATVKDVITFFRESTTRRNYAPNLSRLCETRWSEKYKSIRKFSQHFSELVKSLETLSVEGNYATRKSAYQLHSAVTKPVFIVSLQTIAKYSAVIEPVVNALQAKSIDMISVGKHIKNIKDILRNDREFPDRISNEILQKARAVAMDLNIEISVPRLAHKQTHRSNPPSDNDNEYWRRSLIIPYIDSLISSLNIRFSQENTPAFALSRLHPLYMTKTSIADLHKNAESFQEFYNLDITGELNLWHNLWVTKALSDDQLKDIEVVDLFKEANIFYPAVRKALIILSTIPCTTATVERSFSTLRRVKTFEEDQRNRVLRTYIRNAYVYHLNEIFSAVKNEYTDWDKPIQHPINIRDSTMEALSDGHTVAPLIRVAYLHARRGAKTYFFHFGYQTKDSDYPQRLGSVRGEDLTYILGMPLVGGQPYFPANFSKQDIAVAEAVLLFFSNFAKSGDPNTAPAPAKDLPDYGAARERTRYRGLVWDPYEIGTQFYLSMSKLIFCIRLDSVEKIKTMLSER
nr:unnamed protein product [Callosobruchus analis]